ncbi:Cytochrome b5 seed isoform [Bienertia sinuspersici]
MLKAEAIGKDATPDFEDVGHSSTAKAMMDEIYVGDIDAATILFKVEYKPPEQPRYNCDKTPGFVIKVLQILVPLLISSFAIGMHFYTK